jgi:hypothetical protein
VLVVGLQEDKRVRQETAADQLHEVIVVQRLNCVNFDTVVGGGKRIGPGRGNQVDCIINRDKEFE